MSSPGFNTNNPSSSPSLFTAYLTKMGQQPGTEKAKGSEEAKSAEDSKHVEKNGIKWMLGGIKGKLAEIKTAAKEQLAKLPFIPNKSLDKLEKDLKTSLANITTRKQDVRNVMHLLSERPSNDYLKELAKIHEKTLDKAVGEWESISKQLDAQKANVKNKHKITALQTGIKSELEGVQNLKNNILAIGAFEKIRSLNLIINAAIPKEPNKVAEEPPAAEEKQESSKVAEKPLAAEEKQESSKVVEEPPVAEEKQQLEEMPPEKQVNPFSSMNLGAQQGMEGMEEFFKDLEEKAKAANQSPGVAANNRPTSEESGSIKSKDRQVDELKAQINKNDEELKQLEKEYNDALVDELAESGDEQGIISLVRDIADEQGLELPPEVEAKDYSTRNEAFKQLSVDEQKAYLSTLVANPSATQEEFKATLNDSLEIRKGGVAFLTALAKAQKNNDNETVKVLVGNFDKFTEAFKDNMPDQVLSTIARYEEAKKNLS